jgi:hypothetical protein
MAEWIPVGDGFIEADVVRWKEGIFERRGLKKERAVRVGDRLVTAEVLKKADKDGWVCLLVRGCEATWAKPGRFGMAPLPKGKEIKRKKTSLIRGKVERLLWSDESARVAVASRFLGNRGLVSSAPKGTGKN